MAAPPWTARTKWTLHWYSQGGCDHQWPIRQSPESPGKAVMSRAGVALLTWQPPPEQLEPSGPSIDIPRAAVIIIGPLVILQSPQGRLWCQEPEWLSSHGSPPLTCHGGKDAPLEFTTMSWSSIAHWSVSKVPREGCDVKSRSGSPHMAPPPDVPETNRPSIDIPRGTVIINGPSVILHSPQGRLWCHEQEWLSSHGSPPPDVPRTRGPSIGIHINAVIINGPLVILHSPQGRLWCPEPEWLSSHGSPPLTCQRPTDPPLIFPGGLWSAMAHWSFSRIPREGCDV